MKKIKDIIKGVKPTYDVIVEMDGNKLKLTAVSGNIHIKEFKTNNMRWLNMNYTQMAKKLAHEWNFNLGDVFDARSKK